MKKLLIFLIGGLLLPLTVYADAGAPENLKYEVEVTNKDGIPFYEQKCDENYKNCKLIKEGTIPKGKTFEIYYEENINGEIYTRVSYNNNYVYIKLSDTTIITKEITLNDEKVKKLSTPLNKTVLVNELKVYSSPAKAFKVTGTIKKGEKIKLTHYLGDTWYYIEYKNIKGWIDSDKGTIGDYIDKKLLILEDKELIDENGNTLLNIPKNTIISSYYLTNEYLDRKYYVEYNGKEGYLDYSEIANQKDEKVILLKNAQAFKKYEKSHECFYPNCKGDIEIPKDTELKALYLYASKRPGDPIFYQVEYKNDIYWIYVPLVPDNIGDIRLDYDFVATIKNEKIKLNEEVKITSNPHNYWGEEEEEIVTTIAKGEEVTIIYSLSNEYTHYIETKKGQKGWIEYDLESENNLEESNEDPSEEQAPEEIEIKEKGLSKKELLYICIGGAVAISLTAVVVIILISKKRKSQKQ